MTDIALLWAQEPLAAEIAGADIALAGADLERDAGLRTAVLISLFTDGLARPDDRLPEFDSTDRRGWWGDGFAGAVDPALEGDAIGSRLWLLARESLTPETVLRARQYCAEALAWLVEDGVAARVDVAAARLLSHSIYTLAVEVVIWRPDGRRVEQRFDDLWRALGAA